MTLYEQYEQGRKAEKILLDRAVEIAQIINKKAKRCEFECVTESHVKLSFKQGYDYEGVWQKEDSLRMEIPLAWLENGVDWKILYRENEMKKLEQKLSGI